jgi:putative hydrolase of the HAD superfamily
VKGNLIELEKQERAKKRAAGAGEQQPTASSTSRSRGGVGVGSSRRSGAFEATFFDFGGTLYSYQTPGLSLRYVLQEAIRRLGVDASREELRDAYRVASRAAALEFAPRPYYLHRELFEDTYRRFAEALGAKPDPELLQWCCEQQRQRVLENFELRSDCVETIETLRGAGLHVSIVSNIDDDYLDPMVERAGLDQLLDAWTSSEEAGSCKPDPGIFHHALAKAGCEAGSVLFIGDSSEADVGGGRALGMTTVLIREIGSAAPPASSFQEPHHVIENLSEVLRIAGVS